VLLDLNVVQGKTGRPQGRQQLVAAEAQRLQPLRMAGTHREPTVVEP
jgi:hypothetical protein